MLWLFLSYQKTLILFILEVKKYPKYLNSLIHEIIGLITKQRFITCLMSPSPLLLYIENEK